MAIRTNLTENDVIENMIELAGYLAQRNDESTDINVTIENLHMSFKAYQIGDKENDK